MSLHSFSLFSKSLPILFLNLFWKIAKINLLIFYKEIWLTSFIFLSLWSCSYATVDSSSFRISCCLWCLYASFSFCLWIVSSSRVFACFNVSISSILCSSSSFWRASIIFQIYTSQLSSICCCRPRESAEKITKILCLSASERGVRSRRIWSWKFFIDLKMGNEQKNPKYIGFII